MTSTRRFGCAVVLLATAITPALSTAANAETETVVDGPGNASLVSFEKQKVVTQPAPEEKQSDIVDARIDYRKQFLVVTARVSELRKYNGTDVSVTLRVKGGGRDIFFSRTVRGGLFYFVASDKNPQSAKTCPGGRVKPNIDKAVYRIKVPAGCFGAPDSIRVGFNLLRSRADDTFFVDDLNGKNVSPDFTRTRLGQPIRRN